MYVTPAQTPAQPKHSADVGIAHPAAGRRGPGSSRSAVLRSAETGHVTADEGGHQLLAARRKFTSQGRGPREQAAPLQAGLPPRSVHVPPPR